MKLSLKQYDRIGRVAFMLLMLYSVHLFSFYALVSNPRLFAPIILSQPKKQLPVHHTDAFLLLVKHELVKQKPMIEGLLPFTEVKEYSLAFTPTAPVALTRSLPQCLPDDSYKRYRLLQVFLI